DIEGFTDEAMNVLVSYAWPGNVRELENAIERAVVMCTTDRIGSELLPSPVIAEDMRMVIPGLSMAEIERIAIERTLATVGGSTPRAAEIRGISRRKIQYRLKQWSGAEPDEAEPES